MPLKFIVTAVNENTLIVVTNKIKISTLIIFWYTQNGKNKNKRKILESIPKLTARTNLKTLFQGILALTDFGSFFFFPLLEKKKKNPASICYLISLEWKLQFSEIAFLTCEGHKNTKYFTLCVGKSQQLVLRVWWTL